MRVLVVDDSPYHRLLVSAALQKLPAVSEVATAATGQEAIKRVVSGGVDLLTLDVEMPGMDGFAVLRWVMANKPLPVLVVSGQRSERTAILALELGAFAVVAKPTAREGGSSAFARNLAEAVDEAAALRLEVLKVRAADDGETRMFPPAAAPRKAPAPAAFATGGPPVALVVASSTGGPPALRDLFQAIAPRPVVVGIAQHLPPQFTKSLAARLSQATGWPSREPADGTLAAPGTIWLAPGGRHLTFERRVGATFARLEEPRDRNRWCPSGDLLFRSAAEAFGDRVVALVLTGMGDDGAAGARDVARAGGVVLCESAETAVVDGMPDAAARAVPSAKRLPLGMLGPEAARRLDLLSRVPGS